MPPKGSKKAKAKVKEVKDEEVSENESVEQEQGSDAGSANASEDDEEGEKAPRKRTRTLSNATGATDAKKKKVKAQVEEAPSPEESEEDEEEQAEEKAQPAAVAAAVVNPEDERVGPKVDLHFTLSDDRRTIIMDIPDNRCGMVIGPKGSTIQLLQARSGAKVDLDQHVPEGEPRKMSIVGDYKDIKFCAELVNTIVRDGPQAVHPNAMAGGEIVNEQIECAKEFVGRVIGAQGGNIKDIQSRSGVFRWGQWSP